MQVGTLGDIIFEVSELTVKTFDNFIKRTAGRWEVHQPIGAPVKPEYLGEDQGRIEFDIHLNAFLGIVPRDELEKIDNMAREGLHAPLMLGNRPISDNDWYIESCETTLTKIDRQGRILSADLHLTVREYPITRRGRT